MIDVVPFEKVLRSHLKPELMKDMDLKKRTTPTRRYAPCPECSSRNVGYYQNSRMFECDECGHKW